MLAVIVLGPVLAWGSYRLFRPGGSLSLAPTRTPTRTAAPLPRVTGEFLGSAFLQDLGLAMVRVPAGSFWKEGGEGRTGEYWLARTEVTNAQYATFVRDTGHRVPESVDWGKASWNTWSGQNPPRGYESHPVVGVSWDDAVAYCEWLSRKMGQSFRLPTELEWEKACRAGTRTEYSWGEDWDCSRAMGENDAGSSDDDCVSYFQSRGLKGDQTAPVGIFPANPWGFRDLHGNVWEWCSDAVGTDRVWRGGAWDNSARYCRSANRYGNLPSLRLALLGFRPTMAGP